MKLVRFFIHSSAVILAITAAVKLIASASHERILVAQDPIIGITIGSLLLMAALVELGIAASCFFAKGICLPAMLLAWLSTHLLVYRIILSLKGIQKPCNCLGNVTDALHIPPQTADTVMKIVLAYLLVGSYAALVWLWWQGKKSKGAVQNDQLEAEAAVGS